MTMPFHWSAEQLLALIIFIPFATAAFLGTAMALSITFSERFTAFVASLAASLSLFLTVAVGLHVHAVDAPVDARYGDWFHASGYAFEVSLLADRLSIAMLVVSNAIAFLVARFSVRYLHREPGFSRFYLLLCVFVSGMNLLVLAGSYDLLFAGWEMVGLASMLLIAFFNHRAGPVRGAIRAMITYRIADVGLLVSGVLLHEAVGSAEFADAFGSGAWPHAASALPASGATWTALALLLAVMGKSAQFPLGGWLPRAMEGPTPSSALFYGALSVHAGVYLLLRSAPLLEASPVASAAVLATGAMTALYATLCGRTQSDAKNALAYATMTQVGLMLVGVGLHLWYWVIVHMIAHVCLRLFQLLRTPSALRDAQELRAALRGKPRPRPSYWVRILPDRALARIYYFARHRFFVDEFLDSHVIAPLIRVAARLNGLERGIIASFEPEPAPTTPVATAERSAQEGAR